MAHTPLSHGMAPSHLVLAIWSLYLIVTACTSMYQYLLDMNGMYWYVLVCTGMYCSMFSCCSTSWHILPCCMAWRPLFTQASRKYVPVCTGTYEYVQVQTEQRHCIISITKSSKKLQTGLKPVIFCILTAERTPALREYLNARYIIHCHQGIYTFPLQSLQCLGKSAKMSHVGHAAFGSSTNNILHTAESLWHMLLDRPICELSVLEQCRALANAVRGLCEMWMQAECTATAHGS